MNPSYFMNEQNLFKLFFILVFPMLLINCEDQDDQIKNLRQQIEALEKEKMEDKKVNEDLQNKLQDSHNAKKDLEQRLAILEGEISELEEILNSALTEEDALRIWNGYRAALNSAKQFILTQANYTNTDSLEQLESVIKEIERLFIALEKEEIDTYEFVAEVEKLISGLQSTEEQFILSGSQYGIIQLESKNIYYLDGLVEIQSGGILEIEPGTVIKAKKNKHGNIGMLLVRPGAKIIADGTADHPIIFTHEDDPIQSDGTYPNDNTIDHTNIENLWGGIYILGNATSGQYIDPFAPGENYGEVIVSDGNYFRFGGDEPNDNSGVMTYVSIRHAGAFIVNDALGDFGINSLYLGGVGSETLMRNVEVFGGNLGSVVIAGGTVDISGLVFSSTVHEESSLYFDGFTGSLNNSLIEMGDRTEVGIWVLGHSNENLSIEERKITLSDISILAPIPNDRQCNLREQEIEFSIFENNLLGTIENIRYFNAHPGDVIASIEDTGTSQNVSNGQLHLDALKVQYKFNCGIDSLDGLFVDYSSENEDSEFPITASRFSEIVTNETIDKSPFYWSRWFQVSTKND